MMLELDFANQISPFPGISMLDSDIRGTGRKPQGRSKEKSLASFYFSAVAGGLVRGWSLQPSQRRRSVPRASVRPEMLFTVGACCSPDPAEWPLAATMAGVFLENLCLLSEV